MNCITSFTGLNYATQQMNTYRDEAIKLLSELKDNEYLQSLKDLVYFTTERKK